MMRDFNFSFIHTQDRWLRWDIFLGLYIVNSLLDCSTECPRFSSDVQQHTKRSCFSVKKER